MSGPPPGRAGSDPMGTYDHIRGVVFDLDGTLIDSYDAIAESLNAALEAEGLAPLGVEQVRGMVGLGLETLIGRAMGEDRVERGVRHFRERYERICFERTSLLPEVAHTLDALYRRGYRMAVASNKPSHFGWRLLEGLHVRKYLDTVLGPDVVKHKKPHPEMLQRAMQAMRVGVGETLYVGDMEVDVETARAAGVPVVVVPTGSRSKEALERSGADGLIGSFKDLLTLLPGTAPGSGERPVP